jgi:hypothetical protein
MGVFLTLPGGSRTIALEPIEYVRFMRANRTAGLLAGVLVVGIAGSVCAQSLADVAKKEEERRKQTSPGKVYTNKDLGAVPPSSVPPSAAPSGDAKDAKDAKDEKDTKDKDAKGTKDDKAASKDDKGTGEPKNQKYWSERRKGLQDTLDRDSTYIDALQSRINGLTTEFVNRDDPAQRTNIERERQKAIAELARLKKQIEDDKKAIADLEEEARRAGVPPGWLR